MSPDDFEFISEILKERSGLVLTTNKMYLLESRYCLWRETRELTVLMILSQRYVEKKTQP
jgi:hypothetical protein